MQTFNSPVKQAKYSFVRNHLFPLLHAIDDSIEDVRYQVGATAEEVSYQYTPLPTAEYVIVTYDNGYTKGVNVSCNSYLSICRDVLRALN